MDFSLLVLMLSTLSSEVGLLLSLELMLLAGPDDQGAPEALSFPTCFKGMRCHVWLLCVAGDLNSGTHFAH